ncbi:DUF2786 domain-containing protein [Micromonospora sp. BRA006-A]|nr:DUF2786 domain-containing protein [Micromonospora sp. BRA006-A]
MLSKVRKLLAQAEDPACTPAESAAFMAKATELIARYGVDRALLAARDPAADPVGDRTVEVIAPYARDKAGLLAAVAEPLRCRCVRRRHGNGFVMHLFGFASDLERVELLFTSPLVQAAHGLAGAVVPAGSIRRRSGVPGWPVSRTSSRNDCARPRARRWRSRVTLHGSGARRPLRSRPAPGRRGVPGCAPPATAAGGRRVRFRRGRRRRADLGGPAWPAPARRPVSPADRSQAVRATVAR